MWGMQEHLIESASAFFFDASKMGLVVFSFVVAFALLYLSRETHFSAGIRSAVLYGHLAFLFFPLIFFATSLSCKELNLCEVSLTQTALLTIPAAVLLALVGGLFLVPLLHRTRGVPESGRLQRLVDHQALLLGMKRAPDVFIVDAGTPEAYSASGLKPTIFVSVGMLELFTKKELEAVLLHELGHINEGSHALKTLALLLTTIYPRPVIAPATVVSEEERKADGFAASAQKTEAHLNNAKKKLGE